MFAFLRGTVANKGTSHIDLDVGGVGYEVWVPTSVLRKVVTEQAVTLLPIATSARTRSRFSDSSATRKNSSSACSSA